MSIWLPEKQPPQVSEEARQAIADQLLEEGVITISLQALNVLQDAQEPLGSYLDRFGFDLNHISSEGLWPERVLKISAGLTFLAYRETGYFQAIDNDTFSFGQAIAEIEGIPEAYLSSRWQDKELGSLLETAASAPDFRAPNEEGYHQVLDIGAGCVRYYMEAALAA